MPSSSDKAKLLVTIFDLNWMLDDKGQALPHFRRLTKNNLRNTFITAQEVSRLDPKKFTGANKITDFSEII